STEESIALKAVDLIDTRADLLAANNLLFKEDRYAFFRSAYLQNRNFLIKDGEVEDPFADDEDFDYEDF
ncbi:MlaA family lipoprotein, partial [Oleiphilus sp. HI0117]